MSYQDNNNRYPRSYDDTPDYGRRYRQDGSSGNGRYDIDSFDVDESSYQRRNAQRPQNYDSRPRQQRPQNYDGRPRQQRPQNYDGRTRRYPDGYYDNRRYDNRSRDVYGDSYDSRNAAYDNRRRRAGYDDRYYSNRGGNGRKPKKKTSGGIIAVRVIAIILLIAALGVVGYNLFTTYTAKKAHGSLKDKVAGDTLADYQRLYEENNDFFGWLEIDNTVIDYPVMYTPQDPEKYLHLSFDGKYSDSGELFMDANSDPNGYHYLIYGHHMFNGSMFGSLPKYGEEDFYNEHKTIHFDTRFELGDYEVFAVFYGQIYDDSDNVFKYYEMANLNSESDYNYYVSSVKQLSIYDTGITPTYGQKIITLSTCNYHTNDGRFVVCAVKK